MRWPLCRVRGFTLIDLLVSLAVVAVLAAVALPGFGEPLHRARRPDALAAALHLHQAQERWRIEHGRYASLDELRWPRQSPQGHYRLELPVADDRGFELRLVAQGVQARDRACRELHAVVENGQMRFGVGPRSAAALEPGPGGTRCWPL